MNCPVCESEKLERIYSAPSAVFVSVEAEFPLVVSLCLDCGFAFQASAYSTAYDLLAERAYQNFTKSANFEFPRRSDEYVNAAEMILKSCPEGEPLSILEIGSNRGDLLYLIKEARPDAKILGVEPTGFENTPVPTIKGFYRPELFTEKFDLIILQHVLEHIKSPKDFIAGVKQSLAPNGMLFVEVPSLIYSLTNKVEDFSLEHVNYFTPSSLQSVLSGLAITALRTEPFLSAVCRAEGQSVVGGNQPVPIAEIKRLAQDFVARKKMLQAEIIAASNAGSCVIFYGTSFYFRTVFSELKSQLNKTKTYFFDDHFKEDTEPFSGLKRITTFPDGTLVITCSNNFLVQQKMAKKVQAVNLNLRVLRPWSRLS